MIHATQGDILRADVEALVNTVNCVGVMGRGIALQFKKAFPAYFKAYAKACASKELVPGRIHAFSLDRLTTPRYLISFPTKRHWRGKSRIDDIEAGLQDLVRWIRETNLKSIAIPPLGCGLGGLPWQEVRPRIERAFLGLPDVEVLLFEPAGAPAAAHMARAATAPRMTTGRAALLGLMQRYLEGLLDPFITLLEIHKVMYFLQEAGEPLRLRFEKAPYGPYASNLRHVLHELEGHQILGYGDGEDAPSKPIQLLDDAGARALEHVAALPDTAARLDRVQRLIDGFETPSDLELLTSVHWVATRDGATTHDAALQAMHAWNDRKRRFDAEHVRIAWEALASGGWLPGHIESEARRV